MDLLRNTQQFISRHALLNSGTRVLVGVSGGVDSVVLLHLLLRLGYTCVVAHCNFRLRGKAADGDERFVFEMAEQWHCEYVHTTFDTQRVAAERKISIEMAARDLRYEWFDTMMQQTDCKAVAVAHHVDDLVETQLLNIARGTGLRGLVGMKPKRGHVVRPLLCAQRVDIEMYAKENGCLFRVDATNSNTQIPRNCVRHRIVPLFKQINPAFVQVMRRNSIIWRESAQLNDYAVKHLLHTITTKSDNGGMIIDIAQLLNGPAPETLLYCALAPLGFNAAMLHDLLYGCHTIGTHVESATHTALIDRGQILVQPRSIAIESVEVHLAVLPCTLHTPLTLRCTVAKRTPSFVVSRQADTVTLDADKVRMPLTVRRWEAGDVFQPLGMSGMKKVSDFLIDTKTDRFAKARLWIVADSEKILWLVGLRLDDRCRIEPQTKRIMTLTTLI